MRPDTPRDGDGVADPDGNEFSGEPLTQAELKRLRSIIQADDRARWLWSSIRTIAIWITAVTVAVAAFKNFLVDALTSLIGKH